MAPPSTRPKRPPGPRPLPPGEKIHSHSLCWTEPLHRILLQMAKSDNTTASKFVAALIQAEHRRREEAQKPNGASEEKE